VGNENGKRMAKRKTHSTLLLDYEAVVDEKPLTGVSLFLSNGIRTLLSKAIEVKELLL
jgi:hypothetical protein